MELNEAAILGEVLRKLGRIEDWLMVRQITVDQAWEAQRRVIHGLITFLNSPVILAHID